MYDKGGGFRVYELDPFAIHKSLRNQSLGEVRVEITPGRNPEHDAALFVRRPAPSC